MARLRYILADHLMNSFFLHMAASATRRRSSESSARHAAHLTIAVKWWVCSAVLPLTLLNRAKYLLTLLTAVVVHRMMHGRLVLCFVALIILIIG